MSNSKKKNVEMSGDTLDLVMGGVLGKQISIHGQEASDKLNSGETITVTIPVGGEVKNPATNK